MSLSLFYPLSSIQSQNLKHFCKSLNNISLLIICEVNLDWMHMLQIKNRFRFTFFFILG